MNKLYRKAWLIITQYLYKKRFKSIGINSIIIKPMQIDKPGTIEIKDNVSIYQYAWIMGGSGTKSTLTIDSGVTIGHFVHIVAVNDVYIEKNVLIADKVFISDCSHSYESMEISIKDQGIKVLSRTVIGENSWIGENVCILGSRIGKKCVIGANSVVTEDIPDYCVAVGSPVRIIKKYNVKTGVWERVEKNG